MRWFRRSPAAARVAGEASAERAARAAGAAPGGDAAAAATAAAFFDLDGTVLQGASLFHLARGLHARGFFDGRDLLRFARRQAMFRLRGVEDPAAVREARETALEFIRGRRVDELAALGEEVFETVIREKVWPGTRALARGHLDDGQRVWLVTASPAEIATTIAGRLGMTGALGTVAESVDGVYTGRLAGEILHGDAKAEAVRALAAREGLQLADCAAYSDSANDVPLLEIVGHPCAVNPDPRLRLHARRHGWPVRDYRSARRTAQRAALLALITAAAAGAVAAARAYRRR
ncbi:HAD family hydrolase [Motilibacter aurantiacus]|uniref:HAD family hydrolase n=1 Tax=Motilibacter aurantiacus TaxID=2714955 RepID=UPI00140BA76A|nr:HAD-IB family hydrolase [Motilibacter aurantiacus]NHC44188.1 HAD-IB family hydrolase [Motilibacter aurantiacus]